MKSIRFCKSYRINKVIESSSIVERYIYILNRSKYYTEKDKNKIKFKRHSKYTTHFSDNNTEGSIMLRSGIINFYFDAKIIKVCWVITLASIYFRAFLFGLICSLCYYFFYSKDLLSAIIVLLSIFILIFLYSIIILKERVTFFNNSVI